ncbi:MAG: fused MFS/spermidine synthase [Bacteroidetes bacterium]|nr:fused MFS/spermidine synthase [Bacteroidota bacterium]
MIFPKKILYLFILLEGAGVMCIELASVKMIAPWCGETLYVWTCVIGISILSLAGGYFIGGYMAEKHNPPLLQMVFVPAIVFLILPMVTKEFFRLAESDNFILLAVISSLIIIPLPVVFLAAIPPVAIKILSANENESGNSTGKVYALSTAGGIFSALLTGFFLLPDLGISKCLFLAGMISGLLPLFLFRKKTLPVIIFLISIMLSGSGILKKQLKGSVRILHYSEGMPGQNLVADVTFPSGKVQRFYYINRMGQTTINPETGRSLWSYPDYVTAVAGIFPEKSNVLLLGLGGGTIANYLENYLDMKVTAVEIDPRADEIAKRFFGLSKNTRVIIDDARHYLQTSDSRYDIILFDVFRDVIPEYVMSREAFLSAMSLLNPGGIIMVNFNGFLTGDIGKAGRLLFSTMKSCGMTVEILPTFEEEEKFRNNIFIGVTAPVDFSKTRTPLNRNGIPVPINDLLLKEVPSPGTAVITDDLPCLDLSNYLASSVWRSEYIRGHTSLLSQNGIPLFR